MCGYVATSEVVEGQTNGTFICPGKYVFSLRVYKGKSVVWFFFTLELLITAFQLAEAVKSGTFICRLRQLHLGFVFPSAPPIRTSQHHTVGNICDIDNIAYHFFFYLHTVY